MPNIINATRLPECALVVIIGLLSFIHAKVPVDTLTLVTLFFVVASTMLQNDWRDRFHDIGKGKLFASQKPKRFLFLLIFFWGICFTLVIKTILYNHISGTILLGMTAVGLLYSEARRIALLPVTLVTITVASSTLLSLGFGANFKDIVLFCICIAFIMFGRETLHDIGDKYVDVNYKKTIPIVLGDAVARIASTVSLSLGCVLAMALSTPNVIGSIFILWGLSKISKDERTIEVRNKVDIGLLLLAVGFLVG